MKRWLFFATAILLWASVLIGEGGLPRQGGTYRYTLGPSDPPSLDPVHITDTVSHAVASELFDGLVTFDQDLKIRPAIAKQWVEGDESPRPPQVTDRGQGSKNSFAVTGAACAIECRNTLECP